MLSHIQPKKPQRLLGKRASKKYGFDDGVQLFEANMIRGLLEKGYIENNEVNLPEIDVSDPMFWLIQKEFRAN